MKPFVRFILRNPRPAYGQDVLSLTQLRHYIRLFWNERKYGVCHIYGGKAAFLRYCGDANVAEKIRNRILAKEPKNEYLSRPLQRLLSRKVLQVLRGEVIFVEVNDKQATWKPLMGAPQPPVPDEVLVRDHQFRVEHTILGPRIRRF